MPSVAKCAQCRKPMANIVQVMLGPVCSDCVRYNHMKVTGKKKRSVR